MHLHLDSGYILPYEEQVEDIKNISTKYSHLLKFANYHNPIYPSCTDNTPLSVPTP